MLTLRSTLLALLVSVAGATLSIDWKDYLIIATASSDEELNDPPTFTSQFADLGADFMTMSYPYFQDNVHLDTRSLFWCGANTNPATNKWTLVDTTVWSHADFLPGAGLLREWVSFKGDVALTSPKSRWSAVSTHAYGDYAVSTTGPNGHRGEISQSDSLMLPRFTQKTGIDTTGPVHLSGYANVNFAPHRAELKALADWIASKPAECTMNAANIRSYTSFLTTADGVVGGGSANTIEFNMDYCDTDNDGVAVVDIDVGDNDLHFHDGHLILDSTYLQKFGVFRVISDRMIVERFTIMSGDGALVNNHSWCPTLAQMRPPPASHLYNGELSAIFVHLGRDAMPGTPQPNKITGAEIETFRFDTVILGGVAFYDLISFDGSQSDPYQLGRTYTTVLNTQGCTQFVAPRVDLVNVRLNQCKLPCTRIAGLPCFVQGTNVGELNKQCAIYGDPRVKRWDRKPRSWQGQCDIVMAKSQMATGQQLEIQLRTQHVLSSRPYSVVSEFAMQLGSTRARFNYTHVMYGPMGAEQEWWVGMQTQHLVLNDFTIWKPRTAAAADFNTTFKDLNGNTVAKGTIVHTYRIPISGASYVDVSRVGGFLNVYLFGAGPDFYNGVGACGQWSDGKAINRALAEESDLTTFMEDWMVKPGESLFAGGSPSQCTYPPTSPARKLRGESTDPAFEKAAAKACAKAEVFEDCMEDVLWTGNLAVAASHFDISLY